MIRFAHFLAYTAVKGMERNEAIRRLGRLSGKPTGKRAHDD